MNMTMNNDTGNGTVKDDIPLHPFCATGVRYGQHFRGLSNEHSMSVRKASPMFNVLAMENIAIEDSLIRPIFQAHSLASLPKLQGN